MHHWLMLLMKDKIITMQHQFVSVDRIFSKLIRDIGDNFNEADVVEWCGEALEAIGTERAYEEAVAFIEVKNHQCLLPSGIHSIIQIARNQAWTGPSSDAFCPASVLVNTANPAATPAPSIPVVLDSMGQPISDYDLAYYRPYFDLQYEYYNWVGSSYYKNGYTPVRLKTSSFFESLVCTETNTSLYQGVTDEYTVIQKKILRFSFAEGSIALAYNRQIVDPETGYPMVPDSYSHTTAIVKYITMMMQQKLYYAGREGAEGRMKNAEADWQWYCKQSSSQDMMPQGIDEHQNLLDQRSYLLPRNRYYGFFGKQAQPEDRKFNDPDARNYPKSFLYRGL